MAAAIPTADAAQAKVDISGIRDLMTRGEFASALSAAEAIRSGAPAHRDVLYVTAVCLRYLGKLPDALRALTVLEEHYPRFSRLFQERGHCYVAQRAAQQAIDAFARAVNLNPSLEASWRSLQVLFSMTGRTNDAQAAAGQVARLAELPKEVLAASVLFADGEVETAEQMVRGFLLSHGDHVEAIRLLAQIGVALDVTDDAEVLLENVLRLAPDHHAARYDYAVVLLKRHKHTRAREEIERLRRSDPDNRAYRATEATICAGFGDAAKAIALYRELVPGAPKDAELHLSLGHCLKTSGRTDEAVESYREAAAARSHYGEAYWSLANLKTYRFTDAELARMRSDEATPNLQLSDRYHLCFALGKALEDRGRFEESFAFYERGNALKKTECRYRAERLELNARLQKEICTPEFFAARQGFGCPDPSPIFIVGLPRAGSTLIEQILASHSKIEGTMELSDIPRLAQELMGRERGDVTPRYPGVLAELSAADCRRLGERYIEETRVYRQGRPFFVDKNPNNFRHIGLIHLILPNANFIDARREPLACCFSNYKQLFASGQQFTYSIDDIARYYRMYVELMQHWDTTLPGRILQVDHENVVGDLEANVRRLLDFCQLLFERSCLDFHTNERSVHSASSEQVREPINRRGLDQWREFEPWLGPLRDALGDLVGD